MIWNILIPLLGVAVDQLVKYWAAVSLKPVGTIPLIQDVFHLTYWENTGAAFSMFADRRWLLLAVTVILLTILVWALHKNFLPDKLGRIGLLLTIGGAFGNLIDRLLRGYVIDLFDFRLIGFPVFNVADILLNAGVILMAIDLLILEPKREKQKKEDAGGNHRSQSGT